MTLSSQLDTINAGSIEREIQDSIVQKIAADLPQLTDHSPASPHVVIASALAWGSSLLLYYAQQMPQLMEEYLVTEVFGSSPLPATSAMASLQLSFSTPAPAGGRTMPAGTRFQGGGTTWTLLDSFTYPPGTYGNEQHADETGAMVYDNLLPIVADTPGARYNANAGTITQVGQTITGLVGVQNPSAAFGGADAEDYAAMRSREFQRKFNADILVTPLDYELTIEKYLGGGSRIYTVLPPPTVGYAHFSILYADGNPLISHDELRAYLDARSPHAPTRFVPPVVVDVPVAASLMYDPSMTSQGSLLETASDVIRSLLDPRQWAMWGQKNNVVYRSALITALQNINGVMNVDLTQPTANINLGQPNAVPRLVDGNPTLTLTAEAP